MGNLNCSRCDEDFENKQEANLQSEVIHIKAILSAYQKLQEQDIDALAQTCEINVNSLELRREQIHLIQRFWKIYIERRNLRRLKDLRTQSKYFNSEDIEFTLMKRFFSNLRKKRRIVYPKGQVYEGDCKGGFRDGYGKIVWIDGCSYEGNWAYGYPEGYGKFIYHDNDHFEGKWINPFPCTNDSLTSSTKSFDASSLFIDGYGKIYTVWLHFKNETTEPKLSSPIQSFEYIEKSLDFSIKIIKQTEENLIRIENLLPFKQDSSKESGKYKGDLLGSIRQGIGKMTWPNGNTYTGQWLNDNPHGYGLSTWNDGSQYIGFYKSYCKEGVGQYVWSDKNVYIGEWLDDTMDGIGKYMYADGRVYVGEWKKGNMDGKGKFLWKNGRIFEGLWKAGKKHGPGVTMEADGKVTRNNWNFGRIAD